MKRAKAEPADSGPTCGACKHWRKCNSEGDSIGECFFNPPTVQIDEEGYSIVRPILDESERACGQFRGAN